jgi:SAM-dependent methyltransferase
MQSIRMAPGHAGPIQPAPVAGAMVDAVVGAFDRAARTYDQTGVEFFTPLGRQLVAGAGLRPGHRVLDVGCGRGACTFPAAEAVGPTGQVIGVDLAPAMARATAEKAATLGLPHVQIVEADVTQLDLPAASFDVVVAGFVVFLLPDPATALRSYARLLRAGGRLAMSSYGLDDPLFFRLAEALDPFLAGPAPRLPGRDRRAFESVAGITRLIEHAGFDNVRVEESYRELEFIDCDHCWTWLWSGAGRLLLEQIPAERLGAARRAAYGQMATFHRTAGRLAVRWNVRLTHATVTPGE